MKKVDEEIKSLKIENAQEYDLIAVKAVKRWLSAEIDNITERGVYAVTVTYDIGRDDNGAEFPRLSMGYNSESGLERSGAERFDTSSFMEKSMSVMDDFGALDMWLELKGFDMRNSAEQVLAMAGEAVREMHEEGIIKDRFFREVPVIMCGDADKDVIGRINKAANGDIL
ncbi:MAG: hypothetical protein ACI4JJ_05625 [Huintestinicola sp.]